MGTWESGQVQPGTSGLSATGFTDQTVRDIVHLSAGGREVRIRLSNAFGTAPLTIDDVHVALRQSGASTVKGSTRQVTFGGSRQVVIPAGAREFSDPVQLSVGAGSDLAVSIYFKQPSGPATWHPSAISTNYYSTQGDHSADTSASDYTHTDTSWFFLDGVDVVNPAVKGAVVTFGPSTTDGIASTQNANERYPDDLARRLLALPSGEQMSVLNAGISGNQLLADGGTSGQSALHRFYRDVIDQDGVRAVIIWEGTNDIGDHPDLSPSDLTSAYQQLIDEAHAHGIRVIGATLQPDEGAGYYTVQGNELRESVNEWIRGSGAFDGVADFSTTLEDPSDPNRMLPAYDSGDHLHPNDAGYQAIANAVDLGELTRS
ncbi:MAG: SGNH/GDSL hydrolase family protein [Nocardiopsaceae bacterium]|nr:SGNH/GDSL hydrolase family protein [Nocardiopsaceae bacterium]